MSCRSTPEGFTSAGSGALDPADVCDEGVLVALAAARRVIAPPTLSGRQQAGHFLIVALACLRGLQLAQALLVTIVRFDQYRVFWPVVVTLVVLLAWWPVLFVPALRTARVTRPWFAADLVLASAATLVVSWLSLAGEVETWTNWAFIVGCNTAMVAAVALPSWGWLSAALTLVGVGLVGAEPALASGEASWSNFLGNSASYIGLGAAAALALRHLRRTGQELDAANARARTAELALISDQVRYQDRLTQYRTLHDTVLGTLTAIARGGLDLQLDAVRARAAREADYLRRLLMGDVAAHDQTLHEALGQVIDDTTALGLRIHYLADGLPPDLPGHVVRALAEATREALANVVRHAGTHEAWLTGTGETDGTVIVRVADQGCGFESAIITNGLGLQRSIRERIAEIGGEVVIDSQPGDGTLVELRWTSPAVLTVAAVGVRG